MAMPPKKEDKKPTRKDDDKKPETGLLKRTTAAADHNYWVYVPEDYDPNVAYALVVWLHPLGKNKDEDMKLFTEDVGGLLRGQPHHPGGPEVGERERLDGQRGRLRAGGRRTR